MVNIRAGFTQEPVTWDDWEEEPVVAKKSDLQTFTPLGIFALAFSFFLIGAAAMYWAIRM